MSSRHILVIDDDRTFCESLREHLGAQGHAVRLAHTAAAGLEEGAAGPVDVILLDQQLPDRPGHELCGALLRRHERAKIVFATAFPSFASAVAAIKAGAWDYLSKPFELEELDLSIARALRTLDLERIEEVQRYQRAKQLERDTLVGTSPPMAEIRRWVERAAAADAPVLVTGETGTGKGLVARSIHQRGPRGEQPFVGLNCAALPEALVEAELFGHERGAFTGALSARRGMFEVAEGGTLFLDEIGEMPVQLQSKLLGVLDDHLVRRLGGEAAREIRVRVIAATSVDLARAIRERTFREDLFFRLGVVRIAMPPLRERPGDLGDLCAHLLGGLDGGRAARLAPGELERLQAYPWPGNVRELRNVLERALILEPGEELHPAELLRQAEPTVAPTGARLSDPPRSLVEVEAWHVRTTLAACQGNLSRTAHALGIGVATLKRKLKRPVPLTRPG